MNWGKGLLLTMIAFIGMMAWFLVRAAQNPEALVTEDYYEQELKYQDRINAASRATALGEAVVFELRRDRVSLVFPASTNERSITGDLLLMRPNEPLADRTLQVDLVHEGRFETGTDLLPGLYIAKLEWTMDGVKYFTEQSVVVP